jgi:hypothetical protein
MLLTHHFVKTERPVFTGGNNKTIHARKIMDSDEYWAEERKKILTYKSLLDQ